MRPAKIRFYFRFPWKDKQFPRWQTVVGGNDCGALSVAPTKIASNDFNQFSAASSLSFFPFIAENVRTKWQIVVCRRTLSASTDYECLSFGICTTGNIKESRRNDDEDEEEEEEMPWLATTMAISHRQIENCMRRAHNKTRTLPFRFCSGDAAAACSMYWQSSHTAECLKEIDNICLQMTCQPLIFIPPLPLPPHTVVVIHFLFSVWSLCASPQWLGLLLSPPLPRLPPHWIWIGDGHWLLRQSHYNQMAHKVHATAWLRFVEFDMTPVLVRWQIRSCATQNVCETEIAKSEKEGEKKTHKMKCTRHFCLVKCHGSAFRISNSVGTATHTVQKSLCRRNSRITIRYLFIDTLRYTDRKTRYSQYSSRLSDCCCWLWFLFVSSSFRQIAPRNSISVFGPGHAIPHPFNFRFVFDACCCRLDEAFTRYKIFQ